MSPEHVQMIIIDASFLTQIVFRHHIRNNNKYYEIGVSSIDLNTGRNIIFELIDNLSSNEDKWDKLRTYFEIHYTKELQVHSDDSSI